MFKQLSLGTAGASLFAVFLTATPVKAQIHSFFFEAPTVTQPVPGQGVNNEFDFSGHFTFDVLGDGFLSLDLISSLDPDIPSFSGSPSAVSIVNYDTVNDSFDLFGDSLGSGPSDITLLTFDFDQDLPDLANLSAFLTGDVTATATIGADVLAAILPQVTPGFEGGVVSQVSDVEFTKKAPEPSTTVAFLGLGLVSAGLKLRRKAA